MEVSESTSDAKCRSEALGLVKNMKDFKFQVTLVVWYDLLPQVNLASNILQICNMELDTTISILEKTMEFIIHVKENGLTGSVVAAKELAEEL